jgi:hypothetical protein
MIRYVVRTSRIPKQAAELYTVRQVPPKLTFVRIFFSHHRQRRTTLRKPLKLMWHTILDLDIKLYNGAAGSWMTWDLLHTDIRW